MSRNPFNSLATAAQEIAANWPLNGATTDWPRAEHLRYIDASEDFYDAIASVTDLPETLLHSNSRHGMKVLFRTCNLAALLGKNNGLDSVELSRILLTSESFESLAQIASQPSKVTRRVETRYALVPYIYPIEQSQLRHSTIDNEVLEFHSLEATILQKQSEVTGEHGPQREAICAAHSNRILEGLFRSAVTVCERDTNLFT